MQTFPKIERLCNKNAISNLFANGSSITEQPFRLIWEIHDNPKLTRAQTLIVVPKRNLKLATDRNKVKRRTKEAFRLNKEQLYDRLNVKNQYVNIAIVYQKQEILSYTLIEEKIKLILSRLTEEI